MAITTLAHERGNVANLHLGVRKKVARLLEAARANGAADDPVIRQRLAQVYLEAEYLKLLADRAISAMVHGRELGPESSIAKLVWGEVENHIAEAAADVLGMEAATGEWGRDHVYVRAMTIVGGTTQINKNVIAQRILGLPR